MSPAEIEARLAEVRKSYIMSLTEKREAIVTKWATLSAQWNDETYQSLYLIIHSLAGSAETAQGCGPVQAACGATTTR